jgi:hypothetical protein
VKQLFLAILIIMGIGALIAPAGKYHNISVEAAVKKSQFLSGIKDQLPGAFEISQSNSIAGHNCRQINPDVSFDNKPLQDGCLEGRRYQINEATSVALLKNYLSHIYPSHNFW